MHAFPLIEECDKRHARSRRCVIACILICVVSISDVRTAIATPKRLRDPQATLLADVKFEQRLGQTIPLDVVFRDEQGRAYPLQNWFGDKPVVMALVYYRCPMLCTQVLSGLVKALRALELSAGRDFDVVLVSIDPRETPELALDKKQNYLRRYDRPHAAQGWHFLTGQKASIESLATSLGYSYRYDPKSGQYAHASGIVVLTPLGRTARYFYGIDYPTRDLRLALVEAASGKIGSPVDQVLLFCFHYDPTTGRYGLAILRLLRTAGLATVLFLAGFIFYSLRRERRRRSFATCRPGDLVPPDDSRGLTSTRNSQPEECAGDLGLP